MNFLIYFKSMVALSDAFKDFSMDVIGQCQKSEGEIFEDSVASLAKLKTIIVTLELVSSQDGMFIDEGVLKMMFHATFLLTQNFHQTLVDKSYVTFRQIEL